LIEVKNNKKGPAEQILIEFRGNGHPLPFVR